MWTICGFSVQFVGFLWNFFLICGLFGLMLNTNFFLVNILLFMLGLETTHIMLFWFKAQVQILYLVVFHNCNCMTWVSNGIDFDAWLLFLLMINDFMKYSNSMDFHFAYGQGNGYY